MINRFFIPVFCCVFLFVKVCSMNRVLKVNTIEYLPESNKKNRNEGYFKITNKTDSKLIIFYQKEGHKEPEEWTMQNLDWNNSKIFKASRNDCFFFHFKGEIVALPWEGKNISLNVYVDKIEDDFLDISTIRLRICDEKNSDKSLDERYFPN
jgi:hypothetical protein